jgi:hypothetical protein
MTLSSGSWALSAVHVLVEVHPKRLAPATALLRKNICPVVQFVGSEVPTVIGFVDTAAEKSMLLDCVLKSTRVCWATAAADTVNSNTGNFIFVYSISIPRISGAIPKIAWIIR